MKEDIRIYVDTEYMYPEMTKESGRPTSKNRREIIQIAAIKFDNVLGKTLETFDILIKPILTNPIPEFFTQLTSITKEQMSKGVSFQLASAKFLEFCKNYPIWTFDKDFEVFKQNYEMHNLPFPLDQKPFIGVKALLPNFGIDPDRYSSGTLYKAVNLNLQGHVHNALHDVNSMSQAIFALEKKI